MSEHVYGRRSEMAGLSTAEKRERFNLGLELARIHATPGQPMTQSELAEWCGVTSSLIYMIERKALKKLRRRASADPELRAALEAFMASDRAIAQPRLTQAQ